MAPYSAPKANTGAISSLSYLTIFIESLYIPEAVKQAVGQPSI